MSRPLAFLLTAVAYFFVCLHFRTFTARGIVVLISDYGSVRYFMRIKIEQNDTVAIVFEFCGFFANKRLLTKDVP